MDNIQPADSPKPRPSNQGLRGKPIDDAYQGPEDHELSPEVQLAWFELNREHTQRQYLKVMRWGGLVGAILLPLMLMGVYYIQSNDLMDLVLTLPELDPNPGTAMVYWGLVGVFAGFLTGVGLGALAFWLLQRFQ
jgi:hypothetical protein